MRFASRGIVLAKESFGEADQYIQFLTRDYGVISALAKSARKSKRRYVGGLDLFCHDEIVLRGSPKERPYLVELTVLNSFTALRDQLERMLAAGKMVQWIRKLADVQTPIPAVYSLLGQTLALIEKESSPGRLELLGLVFKMKLLAALGLKPRLDVCVRCGSAETERGLFDVESGGILCGQCTPAHGTPLDPEERRFLDLIDRFRLTAWDQLNLSDDKTQQLTRLMTRFTSYHTHVRLPI